MSRAVRVNVGCGSTPTRGWLNFDNSPTVRLAHLPLAPLIVSRLPGNAYRATFLKVARAHDIRWAKATQLPLGSGVAQVVYSSHMLEHLQRSDAELFLNEAKRVLQPGGTLRLVVPDLRSLAQRYLTEGDANRFVEATLLAVPEASSFAARLELAMSGHRGHAWMYDGPSLCALVAARGFADVRETNAHETRIQAPEPLDLAERADESIYVEATRP